MKKIVKIKNVFLSTTTELGDVITSECDAAKNLLVDAGIPFQELWYNDPKIDERTPVLNSLSSWNWKNNNQRQFTTFPILYWTECYDDWSVEVDHAMGLEEIRSCSLLVNKELIT